jgi:hypothetical protein
MSFLIWPPITVENTANPGQLQSITDTVPYNRTGSVYFDKSTGKGYIYAYNAQGGTLTANAVYCVSAFGYTTDSTDKDVTIDTPSDLAATASYVVAAVAALPSTYYGWVQYKGDNTAVSGLSSEARTAGGQVILKDALGVYAAATADLPVQTCFAVVRVANTAASATGNIRFLGQQVVGTT